MSERVIKAALLGLGTVGTGVYKVLKNQEEEMTAKIGCKVEITKILVRNIEKAAAKLGDTALLTNQWEEIVNDPEIEIVIELIGGINPARDYILQDLNAGKHVVSANKDLIAVHGHELLEAAQPVFQWEEQAYVPESWTGRRGGGLCHVGGRILPVKGPLYLL